MGGDAHAVVFGPVLVAPGLDLTQTFTGGTAAGCIARQVAGRGAVPLAEKPSGLRR